RATVACPECSEKVPTDELSGHLRHRHRLYEFGGQRGDFQDTFMTILQALCRPDADASTWRALAELVHDEQGDKTWPVLGAALGTMLGTLDEARREETALTMAQAIAAGGCPPA